MSTPLILPLFSHGVKAYDRLCHFCPFNTLCLAPMKSQDIYSRLCISTQFRPHSLWFFRPYNSSIVYLHCSFPSCICLVCVGWTNKILPSSHHHTLSMYFAFSTCISNYIIFHLKYKRWLYVRMIIFWISVWLKIVSKLNHLL